MARWAGRARHGEAPRTAPGGRARSVRPRRRAERRGPRRNPPALAAWGLGLLLVTSAGTAAALSTVTVSSLNTDLRVPFATDSADSGPVFVREAASYPPGDPLVTTGTIEAQARADDRDMSVGAQADLSVGFGRPAYLADLEPTDGDARATASVRQQFRILPGTSGLAAGDPVLVRLAAGIDGRLLATAGITQQATSLNWEIPGHFVFGSQASVEGFVGVQLLDPSITVWGDFGPEPVPVDVAEMVFSGFAGIGVDSTATHPDPSLRKKEVGRTTRLEWTLTSFDPDPANPFARIVREMKTGGEPGINETLDCLVATAGCGSVELNVGISESEAWIEFPAVVGGVLEVYSRIQARVEHNQIYPGAGDDLFEISMAAHSQFLNTSRIDLSAPAVPGLAIVPVPEPGTAAAVALGLAAMAAAGRRRAE